MPALLIRESRLIRPTWSSLRFMSHSLTYLTKIAICTTNSTFTSKRISRLARNTVDFLNIVEELTQKKVNLISLKEQIDTTTPQGRFVLKIFASLSELERETIKQRQREGIDLCLAEHRPYGRPKVSISETFKEAYKEWKAGNMTAVQAMNKAGMKPNTWYRRVKEYEGR